LFVLSGETELSVFFATRSHHPPSCYAAPLNKPKDEDDKAEGIPAINVEKIAKEEEILEEGTKGEDERIHAKPQLVKFKHVENAEYYPINLIFGTPEKKVDVELGTWPSEESSANNGIRSPNNKPSPDRNAEPARWRERNAKCAAKRKEEAPSIIKQEDNCKSAVSPGRNAEPARWRERNAECAAKREEDKAPSIIEQEDNCKAAVSQSERIELMKIQLFTSTQRETSIGYKHIVELGLGSLIIFKKNFESSIFVDFVSAEGQELLVRAEVPPGKDAHDQLFGNGGHDSCLGWNLFNLAPGKKVQFRRHYFWFRNNAELGIALHSMYPNDFELAAFEFFDKQGRFFVEQYTRPPHKMHKEKEDMDLDFDLMNIKVGKQPLSTPEAMNKYGDDPYEESQGY